MCYVIGTVNTLSNGMTLYLSAVCSGVRQGSCLSPAIFKVFTKVFILELRKLCSGCHVNGVFVGFLLHADDITLLSPSVRGLQMMLQTYHEIERYVSLSFNVGKCRCMAIGTVIFPLQIE